MGVKKNAMSEEDSAIVEMKQQAEKVLSVRFGSAVRFDGGEDLGGSDRSYTYRYVVIDGPDEVPASAVVKKVRPWSDGKAYDPDVAENPAIGLLNDWAGLEFLNEVSEGMSSTPQCYGGDREAGLFVMQDMGSPRRLDHILLGDDEEEAEQALIQLAISLGRMHASTIGKQALFADRREALGPTKPYSLSWLRVRTRELEEMLDIGIGPEVNEQIDDCIAALETPGPFTAYVHDDPCPDKGLWMDGQIKLLGFGSGAYRHALIDGTYGRILFPSCWCVNQIPGHIPLRMEDEYRNELVAGCPEAGDDALYRQAVAFACAKGAIGSWWPGQMERDNEWGIATYRQRVLLRYYLFARITEEYGQLEALGRWVDLAGVKLREAWGEVEDMPYYPAFREGA